MKRRGLMLILGTLPAVALTVAIVGCNEDKGTKSGGGDGGDKPARLSGGGATFIAPIMGKWSSEYKAAHETEIDYSKSGSSDGIKQVTEKSLDFGCSDAPMKKDQVAAAASKGGEMVHLPLVMGAVAMIYNLPDAPPLKLSGQVIADIYLGKIDNWNNEAIKGLNPGVTMPDLKITPVYRQEGSGTTNIFTEFR